MFEAFLWGIALTAVIYVGYILFNILRFIYYCSKIFDEHIENWILHRVFRVRSGKKVKDWKFPVTIIEVDEDT